MSHQSESEQHAVADKETIVKELKKILVEDLFVSIPEGEIKLEDSLSSDLGVDSVGWVELVTILEEKYGIEITGDEADKAGPELGPMITEDFPQAMDNLIAYADQQ